MTYNLELREYQWLQLMVQKILLKLLADRAWEHEASIHTKFEFEKKVVWEKKQKSKCKW
jgi:hypothetical protein